jgi:hypothetical protein
LNVRPADLPSQLGGVLNPSPVTAQHNQVRWPGPQQVDGQVGGRLSEQLRAQVVVQIVPACQLQQKPRPQHRHGSDNALQLRRGQRPRTSKRGDDG